MYTCNCKVIYKPFIKPCKNFYKSKHGWEVYVNFNGKRKYVAYRKTKKDAVSFYKKFYNENQKIIKEINHDYGGNEFAHHEANHINGICQDCGNICFWSKEPPNLRNDKDYYFCNEEYYAPILWEE